MKDVFKKHHRREASTKNIFVLRLTPRPAMQSLHHKEGWGFAFCFVDRVAATELCVHNPGMQLPTLAIAIWVIWLTILMAGDRTASGVFSPLPDPPLPVVQTRVFSIADFGAVGDGKTFSTAAINKAIVAANAAGGGRVVVPAGTFLTGPIVLLSDVELNLDAGATILFSRNAADYPLVVSIYEGSKEVRCQGGGGLTVPAMPGGSSSGERFRRRCGIGWSNRAGWLSAMVRQPSRMAIRMVPILQPPRFPRRCGIPLPMHAMEWMRSRNFEQAPMR
jgi:hypothetical protein